MIKESYTDFMLIRLARELATIPGALMNYKKFRAERSAVVPQTHDEQVYECPELAVRNKIHEKAGGTSRIAASQGMHSYGETEEGFAYVFSTAKYCPQNNCGVSFDEDVANYVNRALRVIHGSPETDYTPEIIKYAQEVVYHRMLISLLSQESFRPVIEAFQKREDYSQLVDIFQEHHLCANIFSDESLSIVILAGGISGTLDSATGFKDSPSQSFMQKTYPFYEDDLLGFIKSQKDLPQFLYDQTLSREDRLRWLHAFAEDDGRTRVHEEISGVKLGEKSAFLDKAERALQRLKDEGRHAQDEKPFVRMISKDEEVTGIVAGNRLGSLAIAILRLAWAPDGTPTCFRYIKKDNLRPDPTANTWWTPDLADLVAVFARIYKNTSGKSSVEHYQNEARALALASGIFSKFLRENATSPASVREVMQIFSKRQEFAKHLLRRVGQGSDQNLNAINQFFMSMSVSEAMSYLQHRVVIDLVESTVSNLTRQASVHGIKRLFGIWSGFDAAKISEGKIVSAFQKGLDNMNKRINYFNRGSHDIVDYALGIVEGIETATARKMNGVGYIVWKHCWDGIRLAQQIGSNCLCPFRIVFAHINSLFSWHTW